MDEPRGPLPDPDHFLALLGHEMRNPLGALRNALDLIEAFARWTPGIVVCDLGLPVVDGFEVARTLRTKAGPDLLLIALSGFVDAGSKAKAREAGFDTHLSKPVELDRLLDLFGR